MKLSLVVCSSALVSLGIISCRGDSIVIPLVIPNAGPVAQVSVFSDPLSGKLHVGGTAVLSALASDAQGTFTFGKSVSFAASPTTIVRLDPGTDSRHRSAVALTAGTVVITVVIDGVYGSTTLIVLP